MASGANSGIFCGCADAPVIAIADNTAERKRLVAIFATRSLPRRMNLSKITRPAAPRNREARLVCCGTFRRRGELVGEGRRNLLPRWTARRWVPTGVYLRARYARPG